MTFKDLPDIENEQVLEWILEYKKTKCESIKQKIMGMIILSYTPFIKAVVHSFARRANDPKEDLYQVSSIGLIKAVQNFNPSVSDNFKSYATAYIVSEIKHYLRDKMTVIRAPREVRELSYRIKRISEEFTLKNGYEPSDEEIALALDIEPKKVVHAMDIDRRTNPVSFDNTLIESDTIQDITEKDSINKYREDISNADYSIIIKDAINSLDETTRKIIEMSFFEEKTKKAIAKELNINEMKVARTIKKALQDLIDKIKEEGIENYD